MSELKRKYRERLFNENPYCFVCKGRFEAIEETTLEHIIPLSRGGQNIVANYAISHEECNKKKGNKIVMNHTAQEYVTLLKTLKGIIQGKDKEIEVLHRALKIKKINLHKQSQENDFLKRRVKEVFGMAGYMKLQAHTSNPDDFDINGFKEKHDLREDPLFI